MSANTHRYFIHSITFRSLLFWIVLALLLITVLFPILWLIDNSFKDNIEVYKIPPTWRIQNPTLEVYRNVITGAEQSMPWYQFLGNSLVVGLLTSLLATTLSALAGYAFARFPSRGMNTLLIVILLALMLPGPVIMIPLSGIVLRLGLYDRLIGLVFAHTALVLPFLVWLSVGNFRSIPLDMEEAALVDGCTRFQAFIRVVLPMARIGLATSAIFSFLISWGDYPFALILFSSREHFTVPLGLATYITEFNTWWNQLAVATLITLVPVLVIISFAHQHVRRGILAGATKG
jgi:multiple sugar transport system permease protein